jgi:hypothetical protein
MVAKADKRAFHELIDTFKTDHKNVLNQWAIILIVNEALNAVTRTDAWRTSFIRANFWPSQCKPFTAWLERHKGTVDADNYFFRS